MLVDAHQLQKQLRTLEMLQVLLASLRRTIEALEAVIQGLENAPIADTKPDAPFFKEQKIGARGTLRLNGDERIWSMEIPPNDRDVP